MPTKKKVRVVKKQDFVSMTVKDVMETRVQSVHIRTKGDVIASLMIEGFGAVPVIDKTRTLIGIVSEHDLLGAIDDGRDRHGRGAVPELIEYGGQVADHRPYRQHIQIAIIGDGVHAIIDVTDIAAADDRRRIVSDHQLVVHAAIDPAEIENEVEN